LPVYADADYQDLTRPQIVDISINPKVKYQNSRYLYEVEVDLIVKVKSNPISRILVDWKSPRPSDAPCMTYERADLLAGGSQLDVGKLREIPGLLSKSQAADGWNILKYKTTIPMSVINEGSKPCLGIGRVSLLSLVNLSGRGFEIETPEHPRGAKGIFTTNVDYVKGNYGTSEYDEYQKTCSLTPSEWSLVRNDIRLPCTHNINWDKLTIDGASLVRLADEAKAAAAELKAKQEAEAKAAAEKAAAELKAKQEAEAAAKAKAEAAKKKVTITCVKGKLTKKVTAVNPKCPAGYKKK
jgi:hypothetical protein